MAGLCNRNGVVSYKFVNMKKLILALALLCAFKVMPKAPRQQKDPIVK